jgi:uncharacterized membrane protein YfcA
MATADRRALAFATNPWLPLALAWATALAVLAWEDPLVGVLGALGFVGAFLSGLVGVGGAIVMIPLLLYVPPLLGLPALGIRTVTAITIVQVAVAALSSLAGHSRAVNGSLFVSVGLSMIGASFLGALASAVAAPEVLEAVFATLALAAALMMLLLRGRVVAAVDGQLSFNRALAMVVGGSVGFLAGLVGAGGAFILVPLMLHVLRIPLRVVVGTSLAILAASSLAGLAGKALTGQVDWLLALGLVVGALPGGRLGSHVSQRTRAPWLATILGLVLAAVAARMWLAIVT